MSTATTKRTGPAARFKDMIRPSPKSRASSELPRAATFSDKYQANGQSNGALDEEKQTEDPADRAADIRVPRESLSSEPSPVSGKFTDSEFKDKPTVDETRKGEKVTTTTTTSTSRTETYEETTETIEKITGGLYQLLDCGEFDSDGNIITPGEYFLEGVFQRLCIEILQRWKTEFLYPTIRTWVKKFVLVYLLQAIKTTRKTVTESYEKKIETMKEEHKKEKNDEVKKLKEYYHRIIIEAWEAYEKTMTEMEYVRELRFKYIRTEERAQWAMRLEAAQIDSEEVRKAVPRKFDPLFTVQGGEVIEKPKPQPLPQPLPETPLDNPVPGTSEGPVPGTSEQPLPGTSEGPVPGTSEGPVPGTSEGPVPGTSEQPLPGTSEQPLPGTSEGPVPGTSEEPVPGEGPKE